MGCVPYAQSSIGVCAGPGETKGGHPMVERKKGLRGGILIDMPICFGRNKGRTSNGRKKELRYAKQTTRIKMLHSLFSYYRS